jgi:hypothetical protein
VTRQVITNHLRGKVAAEHGDVRAVAVYAKPDHFDREWKLIRTFTFLRRHSRVGPGELHEVAQVLPADQQRLAKLVVTRLAVPDDGEDDKEVLKVTVDLVSKPDVWERRAAFQELLASLAADGLATRRLSRRSKTCSTASMSLLSDTRMLGEPELRYR